MVRRGAWFSATPSTAWRELQFPKIHGRACIDARFGHDKGTRVRSNLPGIMIGCRIGSRAEPAFRDPDMQPVTARQDFGDDERTLGLDLKGVIISAP